MKKTTLKLLSALFAAIMLMQPMFCFAAGESAPQSYSLENFFNVEYGDKEENVTAGCLEPGDPAIVNHIPEIYAVTDTDDLYVVDEFNQTQHSPVKQYDCKGRYIRTIPCDTFTNGDILGMIAYGDFLYVRTSDDYLCSFNTKTSEVTKHTIEKVDGFNYYGIETVENRVALMYVRKSSVHPFYDMCFQTFDTEKQNFVPSDDIISVEVYKDEKITNYDSYMTKIKFDEFELDMGSCDCDIPLGISKDGNLYVEHHWGFSDTYGEYDKNGNQVSYGSCSNNESFFQYVHMVGNYMTTWEIMQDTASGNYEYTICKIGLNEGAMTEEALLYAPISVIYSDDENSSAPVETLTVFIEIIDDGQGADSGPLYYTITDKGEVFIIDSMRVDAPIKHFSKDGKYVETLCSMDFSGYELGFSAVNAIGNKLYIVPTVPFGCVINYIYEYDTESKTVTSQSQLPIEIMVHHESARTIVVMGKYLVYDQFDYEEPIYMYDTEKHEFINDKTVFNRIYDKAKGGAVMTLEGKEYFISISENGEVYPHGVDKDGNIIVQYNLDGISYRKYTPDGKLLAFAEETYDDLYYYIGYHPEKFTGGAFVRARTTNKVYSLDRVVFNDDYFKNAYDINFDGAENTADAVAILKYSAEMITFDMAQEVKADINGDFKTNTADAVAVLKYCAGM